MYYGDDFSVILRTLILNTLLLSLFKVFHKCGLRLQFNYEVPKYNELQFLNTRLNRTYQHVSRVYSPRLEKNYAKFSVRTFKYGKN